MKRIISLGSAFALVLGVFFINITPAFAITAGPNNGSTFSSITFSGADHAWSNPSNAATSNNLDATATITVSSNVTQYLRATGYGFSVPSDATIDGIQVRIERAQSGSGGNIQDRTVQLVKNNVVGGQNKAATTTNWPTSDTYATYGGTLDLWSQTWTPTEINNANFGAVLSVGRTPGGDRTANVDHIEITVYYSLPVDSTPPSVTIDSTLPNPTNTDSTITWHANENGSYSVRVGGASCSTGTQVASGSYSSQPATVNTPISAGSLNEGDNTIRVCVTDTATNVGQATASVVKDTLAPTTIITGATDGNGNPVFSGGVTNSSSMTVDFNVDGTGSAVSSSECKIDDDSYTTCTSPKTYSSLSEGSHSISVRSTDEAGNTESTATFSWTIDSDVFNKGMVTLSFDDGWKSIFNNIGLLGSFKSTQYLYSAPVRCNSESSGAFCSDFMSIANALTLYSAGHDVAAHTRSHLSLPSLATEAELLYEADGSRLDILQDLGIPVNNFAYPFGEVNAEAVAKLKSAGFSGARTVTYFPDEMNSKSTDRYALFARQVNSDTTVAEVEGWIDDAIARNQWLILVFHQIEDTCAFPGGLDGDIYCTDPDDLSDIVAYLSSKGSSVDVVTVTEGLALMNDNPVSDSVAPVIVQADIVEVATSPAGAAVSFLPTVTDFDAGLPATLNAFCTALPLVEHPIYGIDFPTVIVSGQTFPIGVTTVDCSAFDTGGNIGTHSFTVTVTDSAPVIEQPENIIAEATSPDGAVVIYATPEVIDVVDTELVALCLPSSGSLFGIGDTEVECNAGPDSSGNFATPIVFTITVQDTTGPEVTLNGDSPVTIEKGGVYEEQGATAEDLVDGSVAVVIGGDVVDTNTLGSYVVTYSAVDAHSNESQITRTVNVVDTTAPNVTIDLAPAAFINETNATFEFSSDDTEATLECKHDGGDFEACVSPITYESLSEDTHTFVVRATDPSANFSEDSAVFTVDLTKPQLTVNSLTTNDTTPTITGTTDDSADVLATINGIDYLSTPVSGVWSVTVPAENELIDGEYTVSAVSTDAAGNESDIAQGTLTIDTLAPNLSLDLIVPNATVITGTTDPEVIVSVEINAVSYGAGVDEVGNWTLATPSLPDALYPVLVTATDGLGNFATTESLLLIDTTSPVIALDGDDPQVIEVDSLYVELGATVTDNLDPSPLLAVDASSVDTAIVGSYSVLYDAEDWAGNVATQVIRTVNVVDTLPPVITLSGFSPVNLAVGQSYIEDGASAEDNYDGDISGSIVIGGDIVDTDTVGVYLVTYNVSDSSGNIAVELTRTVVVSDLEVSSEQTVTPTTNSATITWTTSHPATSRVIYDTVSHDPIVEPAPNYGYANSTVEDATLVMEHSVVVSGLSAGTTYFFRPVSHGSPEVVGAEISVTTQSLPPPPPPPPSSSRGGGGSSGNRTIPIVAVGEVLGASVGTSGNAQYIFTKNLTIGSTGMDVTELQKRLMSEGVYSGPVTGYFGPLTFAGVKAYQAKNGIDQVGHLGPITRAKLNGSAVLGASIMDEATRMTMIKQIQEMLVKLQAELATLIASQGGNSN